MKNIFLVATFVVAAIFAASAAPFEENVVATEPYVANKDYLLPETLMPDNYKIKLQPYLLENESGTRFTFHGDVEIEATVKKSTNEIKLHSKNLTYSLREIKIASQNKQSLTDFQLNEETDIITYKLSSNLTVNQKIILYFKYTGKMEDDMKGFYRSSYKDRKNETRWLGSTQFQTHHARRAFPSFDEPKFKATYELSLTHHKSMNSVSNSVILNSIREKDYVTDNYNKTPKMSTYLVAFIVSDFNERSDGNFSILSRPELYEQTEYSFDVGQKLLKVLDDYLNLPYYGLGVEKMHLAAIPDFSAGAMENWGLLTFRERNLLFVEESTTLSAKQAIAAVIAHEQAHMWFGDLVTCHWWSYAWLNEGFARYFQYFATAQVESGNELEKQFVVDQIHSVMDVDATIKTNPMSDENTYTPAHLSRQFNSITYNKGATVIRMIRDVMGESNFKKALQNYLKKYQLQNTIPQNLLDSLKDTWPLDTKKYADRLFKSFTEQVGYPVVTVNVTSKKIRQERFLFKRGDGSNTSLLYTIPITYTTEKEKNFISTAPKIWLEETTAEKDIELESNKDWVIANVQESGYYRVNYNIENWHNIHKGLNAQNWSNIHEINRAQIVDDLFNLARGFVIEYELALSILEYLGTETNYLPWTAAFNGYSFLTVRLGKETRNFAFYIRDQLEKVYNMLGFEERNTDSVLDIYNRAKVIAWSCKYGNSDCIKKAKTYFNKMKTNKTPVPVNIRSAVYCTAMREGNLEDYNTLYEKFKKEKVATEQTLVLSSLGCVKNDNLTKIHYNNIIKDDVRLQDKTAALSSLYSENYENVDVVFKLVTDGFKELANALGGMADVANVISNIASRFTEEKQQNDLKAFNAKYKHEFGSANETLVAAERTVEDNLKWAEDRLSPVKNYFEKRAKNSANTINLFTTITLMLFAAFAAFIR